MEKAIRQISKAFLLLLYYGFARHLPPSNQRVGRWARPVRKLVCERLFRKAGRNINVEAGALFGTGDQIEIGDNSSIGVDSKIYGPLTIGRDVMMGPEVVVITISHRHERNDISIISQGTTPARRVHIEDDVWIGQRAIILPGIRIGQGSIVGAAAVVTKDVEPFTIVAGNPARVIKRRRSATDSSSVAANL